jgi:hypothetical protein
MPIFGQVWLWAILAFAVGALTCWIVVARPAHRHVERLEARLAAFRREVEAEAAQRRDVLRADRDPDDELGALERLNRPAGFVPGFGDPIAPAEVEQEHPFEPAETTRLLSGQQSIEVGPELGIGAERGPLWFGDLAGAPRPDEFDDLDSVDDVDQRRERLDELDLDDSPTGTIFTQTTQPVSAELISRLDAGRPAEDLDDEDDFDDEPVVAAEADEFDDETEADLAEDTELDDELDGTDEFDDEPVPARPAAHVDEESDDFDEFEETPTPARPGAYAGADHYFAAGVDEAHAVELAEPVLPPIAPPAPLAPPLPQREVPAAASLPGSQAPTASERTQVMATGLAAAFTHERASSMITPGVNVERSSADALPALPKRVPSKPRTQTPFGVTTSSASMPQSVTADLSPDDGRSRALFEPIVPADLAPDELPKRTRAATAAGFMPIGAGAPGPFGPSSAMPLAGGASPSPEFTVKASVTARKYCTQDSPLFGRAVAEVWFQTVADAEGAGFRPLR